jgi:hypothetical protein
MMFGLSAFTNDTEGMVLHDGSTADASQQTLLHSTVEAENCNFGRGDLDFDGDLAKGNPWNENTERGMSNGNEHVSEDGRYIQDCHEDGEPELLRADKSVGIVSPFSAFDVVNVAHDDKHPGSLVDISTILEVEEIKELIRLGPAIR